MLQRSLCAHVPAIGWVGDMNVSVHSPLVITSNVDLRVPSLMLFSLSADPRNLQNLFHLLNRTTPPLLRAFTMGSI